MESPLVSCIVAAYNVEDYLSAAIESILAQTYRPIEVVVVDDGSTDTTAAVGAAFGEPVRVVTQPSAGPAATRNTGLAETRGELVAFLDGDDLWHPDKLARQVACLQARPDVHCCVTHVCNFWSDGHDEEAEYYEGHPRMQPLEGWASGALLARRSVFDQVGAFNPELWFVDAQDWFQRGRAQGVRTELLPDVLVQHRLHSRNITRRMHDESRREWLWFVKSALDRRRGRTTRS